MILIIGLGNPGEKYEKTRHNIGFMIIDEFVKKNDFSDFNFLKKFNADISNNFNNKIIVAKPLTFMNDSGKAVKKIVSSFKFQVSSLFIIHDDIDLPLGKIKISKNRGAGGHKGIESIIQELSTKDFIRFRIGIKSADNKTTNNRIINIEKFVLEKFSKNEEKILKEVIKKTVGAIEFSLKHGIEKTMNKYNL